MFVQQTYKMLLTVDFIFILCYILLVKIKEEISIMQVTAASFMRITVIFLWFTTQIQPLISSGLRDLPM